MPKYSCPKCVLNGDIEKSLSIWKNQLLLRLGSQTLLNFSHILCDKVEVQLVHLPPYDVDIQAYLHYSS